MHTVRAPAELIEAACASSGLERLGDDSFREGLEALVASLNRDADLTPAGVGAVETTLIKSLVNRLEVEQWWATNPAPPPVEDMTLVVGLPRTGTTALVSLLAADPEFRALRQWEAAKPCPPPSVGAEDDDPRVVEARAFAELIPPEWAAMHIFDPLGPEEDFEIVGQSFVGGHYNGFWPVPGYTRWWLTADNAPAFAHHERVLRLLSSERTPRHWLLKAPMHLFTLASFFERYPQSRIIMTHRDPAKAIPSVCSLMTWAYESVTDGVDLHAHGSFQLDFWSEGMRRALADRARIGAERFIDVYQGDLIRDPLSEVERIYSFLGRDLSADTVEAIRSQAEHNAAAAPDPHRYTAADYGLTEASIRASFGDYVERFALASPTGA